MVANKVSSVKGYEKNIKTIVNIQKQAEDEEKTGIKHEKELKHSICNISFPN